jgi:hypothetical protein
MIGGLPEILVRSSRNMQATCGRVLSAALVSLSCQAAVSNRPLTRQPRTTETSVAPVARAAPVPKASEEVSKRPRILDTIQGSWGWTIEKLSCTENPHTIEVSADNKQLVLSHAHPSEDFTGKVRSEPFLYNILEVKNDRIRMSIDGEQRRTSAGELVVWDLVVLSPDEYCWWRTDWQSTSCTHSVVRCPPGEGSL